MKSVHIYYPRLSSDLAKIVVEKNMNGMTDVHIDVVDPIDEDGEDGEETVYFPVYIEEYRDQYPKPLVGRGYIDSKSDPNIVTIELFNPEFAKSVSSTDINNFAIIVNALT